MRYQLPPGHTEINVGGEQFNANDKGVITVPDQGDYSALLAAAGVYPVKVKVKPPKPE